MIGRALVLAALAAPSLVDASPDLGFTVPGVALHGRVVDEWGKPIVGAEVLLCSDVGPCIFASSRGVTWRGTVAGLVATLPPTEWNADGYTLTTTGADGSWNARLVLHPRAASDVIRAVIAAPHRELVERTTAVTRIDLHADVVLRPTSTLDVAPRCGNAPCVGPIELAVVPQQYLVGTHVERLAPATYTMIVYANRNAPGERRGTAVVDATFTPRALQVTLALHPVGTGRSIRGTASLGRGNVSSTCWGNGVEVHRTAPLDASASFELHDVGAAPCVVETLSGRASLRARVDALPATGVVLR